MDVGIVDCGSSRVGDIVRIVGELGYSSLIFKLEDTAYAPLNEARCKCLIMSGGPRLFTDTGVGDGLVPLFQFTLAFQKPMLGICLSHQGLASQFGGIVYRGLERRSSETLLKIKDHPLLAGLEFPLTMVTDHCEGVTLPNDFDLLVHSEAYPVEMMVHRHRPIVGVQFHPESSGQNGFRLFHNFFKTYGI